MQRFIILNKKQKFYHSPEIADLKKNIAFSPKSA